MTNEIQPFVVEGILFNHTKPNSFSKKKKFSIFFFSEFFSYRQLTLDMGVFIRFMGSPACKDLKDAMGEVNFQGT